ncbi:hypothetical protein [Streptomyces vinaceus]|uniref:hypothetical protein n=1 Tax=Streptomyces vinaceus TaxID=1960 RepID=UPI0036883256
MSPLTEACGECVPSSLTVRLRRFRFRHQGKVGQQESVEGGRRAVCEDRGAFGVDPDGGVVEEAFLGVLASAFGRVPVGEHLVVGGDHDGFHVQVLVAWAAAACFEAVPQVWPPGRPIPPDGVDAMAVVDRG